MEVIYEDNHLIAVNKNCHELVQGDKTGDNSLAEVFLPLFRYAETVNLGKQTVFGLGRIRIVEPA